MVLSAELIRRLRSLRRAEFARGATPEEVELAEGRLGVEFPESYKAFLGHLGWASLEGLELYGLGVKVPTYSSPVKVILSERTEIERGEAKVGASEEMTPWALRATMIFRPEDGTWKVVHRHADPITTEQSAESVVQE